MEKRQKRGRIEGGEGVTNLEHFRHYMEPVCSPDSFINMGFYWMISAALQRRVWMGSNERPLFPNMYMVLCAEPGIGKGLTIKPIDSILRSFHLNTMPKELGKGEDPDDYLTIPIAADTTTFEALTRALAKAVRRIPFHALDKDGVPKKQSYSHNSIAFALEEMSSLFQKQHENVTKLLLKTYDCGPYKYDTKNKGTDIVPRSCVNLLAGTTPSFMEQGFNEAILTDGWASRTIFVVEHTNRFESLFMAEPTPDQLASKERVVEQVRKLTELYGIAEFTPEAYEYLQLYWTQEHPILRLKCNPKIKGYYARKNIHVMKLACAIHFADSTDMFIGVEEVKLALSLLLDLEKRMAFALEIGSKRNPLEVLRKSIVHQLLNCEGRAMTLAQLVELNVEAAREQEVREVLNTMSLMGHAKLDGAKYVLLKEALPKNQQSKFNLAEGLEEG